MKSCLKMLLVAGAFAVSLGAFQDDALAETQLASWYGPGLEGNLTASGDIFEPYTEYTAASPYLPFGTDLLVTYGGNSVVVEVTDRGPYTGGRDIDLSALAAEELGLTYIGVDYVDVQVLNQGPSPNYWRDTRAGAARRPRPFPFAGVSKQIAEVLRSRLFQATG